ncbi:MAG TPA: hypothetical protein VKW76_01190 [Candidatus Binatia bacterium]|nr:hypothetical protein [Candidatus Binatia bacterium]
MATTEKGATSAQGWYLFLFLLGFTLGPAGLYGLGWPVALLGFVMMAVSLGGFRSIKDSSPLGLAEESRERRVPVSEAVKSF